MADTANKNVAERRYLLGTLSEDEVARMEEAFFADDAKFEELELAEDELIDAYVQHELSPDEHKQFEKKLRTSPRLVERVHFAEALTEKVADSFRQRRETLVPPSPYVSEVVPKTKVRWWDGFLVRSPAFALAACLVILPVGGVALVTGWLRLRSESERINSERAALQRQKEQLDQLALEQRAQTERIAADLQRERNQREQDQKLIEELLRNQKREGQGQRSLLGTVASIFLTPGSLRSGGSSNQLTLQPHTRFVELKLLLERDDYRSYRARVNSASAEVFNQRGLKPRKTGSGQILLLSIPSDRLPPDDYVVTVHGLTPSGQVESVSDYAFRVPKK